MTELLGTLKVLAETSGLEETRFNVFGMGSKRKAPPAPGQRDAGDDALSTFQ